MVLQKQTYLLKNKTICLKFYVKNFMLKTLYFNCLFYFKIMFNFFNCLQLTFTHFYLVYLVTN